jgi:hypothetical protein
MIKHYSILIQWIVTVSLSIISICGVMLSLACIYALPNRSVNPIAGSFYFFCATCTCVSLLLYSYSKETNYLKTGFVNGKTVSKDGGWHLSDKLIKWATLLMAYMFILSSLVFSFICIYALPNRASSPSISVIYFSCGLITLLALIWRKNKIN